MLRSMVSERRARRRSWSRPGLAAWWNLELESELDRSRSTEWKRADLSAGRDAGAPSQ